ncbi:hypothetical protein [Fibrella aestuarina]|nr:hypothetical protein [Fibrella aestuarina]
MSTRLLTLLSWLSATAVVAQTPADTSQYYPRKTLLFLNRLAQRPDKALPLSKPRPRSMQPVTERAAMVIEMPAESMELGGKGGKHTWSPKGAKKIAANDLLSKPTLNRYMAVQTVRYLTGKEDVSYYDTYFSANSSDGLITLGRTKTNKDSAEQVQSVWNYGLKTKIITGLGNLFSGRKFSREVGLYANFTVFGRGSIWYDKVQVDTMRREREYILQTIVVDYARDTVQFNQQQRQALAAFLSGYTGQEPSFEKDTAAFRKSLLRDRIAFYGVLDKKYKDQYFELEMKAGKPRVNYVRSNWWTVLGNLSGVTDAIRPDSTQPAGDGLFIGAKAGLSYSVFTEDFRREKDGSRAWYRLRSLATLSATVQNTNQLRLLETYGADAAPQLRGKSITKDGSTYWQGPYENWAMLNLEGRILLTMPNLTNVVSLDLFGGTTTGRYASQNLGFGFLFSLPDQTKKAPVNVELMANFMDLNRQLLPGKSALDRLQVGISLALPFNSNLNNL